MNRMRVASALVRCAKALLGLEFDTKEELDKYKKEHDVKPGTKLTVKKPEKKTEKKDAPSSEAEHGQPGSLFNKPKEFKPLRTILVGPGGTVEKALFPSNIVKSWSKQNGTSNPLETPNRVFSARFMEKIREGKKAVDLADRTSSELERKWMKVTLVGNNRHDEAEDIFVDDEEAAQEFLEKYQPKALAKLKKAIAAGRFGKEALEVTQKGRHSWLKDKSAPAKKEEKAPEKKEDAPAKKEEKAPEKKEEAPAKKEDAPAKKEEEKTPEKEPEIPSQAHTKTKVRVKTLRKVQNILDAHDLEENSDEMGELAGFKKTLGQRIPEKDKGKFYVRNESQLKAAFLKNMKQSNYDSPEEFKRAKQRIQDMPVSDFGKVLAAINDDDAE